VLKFNKGEAYPNEEAYEVKIIAMIPDVSISVESDDEDSESESVESDDDFANRVESAKNALLADNDAEIS
jgi:hypothetical protein